MPSDADLSHRGCSGEPEVRGKALNRVVVLALLACCVRLGQPDTGWAQNNQLGGQTRANAASRAVVLAVQQGISALPPTSGQSFLYAFDFALGVPVRTERLGPISLRASEVIGAGELSIRAATSYFALPASLGPINYRIKAPGNPPQFAKLGTDIDAKVEVLNLTVNYGINRRVEANLNLPIVVVDAQASQIFSADLATPRALGFRPSIPELDRALQKHALVLRTVSFSRLGFRFNDGTHAGVGRISLGTKALIYAQGPLQFAAACDFYFPSPSEQEFAGSDSASILPRVIGTARVADWLRFHLDAGYDYDLDVSELRRFVWDIGLSLPTRGATFDIGMGGSRYATPITWTPTRARAAFPGATRPTIVVTAIGDNETGTNYVDFLAGAKVRVANAVVLSGAINVPVVDTGLQPRVAGTVALEVYF